MILDAEIAVYANISNSKKSYEKLNEKNIV